MTPVLELSGISKRFGDIVANENISIALRKGKFWRCLAKTAPARRH